MLAQTKKQYTWRDLLAMPDDGVERWIVDGELKEWYPGNGEVHLPRVKDRFHGRAMARIATELLSWLDGRPEPQGWIGCHVGVILAADPETTVSIDLAYFLPEVAARQTQATPLMVGIPELAIEILSPSDTIGYKDARLALFRGAGVPLVWMVDPLAQAVTIYARDARPRMVAAGDELACEPHLPGFRIPAARLFP